MNSYTHYAVFYFCHQAYNAEETMAISSQMMNRNNYLVILEEIIKGGSVKRKKLPAHFNTLLPPDQVYTHEILSTS